MADSAALLSHFYLQIEGVGQPTIQELTDDLNRAWPVSFDQVRVVLAIKEFGTAAREGRDLEKAALGALDLIRRPMAILRKI